MDDVGERVRSAQRGLGRSDGHASFAQPGVGVEDANMDRADAAFAQRLDRGLRGRVSETRSGHRSPLSLSMSTETKITTRDATTMIVPIALISGVMPRRSVE